MDLIVLPESDESVRRAFALALAGFDAGRGSLPEAYASRWRLAAFAEGACGSPIDGADRASCDYARSPRSSRGVTRA